MKKAFGAITKHFIFFNIVAWVAGFVWLSYYTMENPIKQLSLIFLLMIGGLLTTVMKKRASRAVVLGFNTLLLVVAFSWVYIERDCVLLEASIKQNRILAWTALLIGADANSRDYTGGFPMLYAGARGDLELTKLLLNNGAEIDASKEGWTPLAAACWGDHVSLAQYLAEQGAQVEAVDDVHARAKCELVLESGETSLSKGDTRPNPGRKEQLDGE